jgi:biotin transport system substrate-specific component
MKAQAQTFPTLVETVYPSSCLLHDGAAVVTASLFIAVCAQLSIPLPFTPVPLSGGTLGVLYAGALLGSRRGAAAVGLYLLEGCAGLPVFSGGAAGFAHLLGPTGGYLAGFPVGAFVTGLFAERGWDRTPGRAFLAVLAGSLPIFALGLLGLSRFVPGSTLLAQGLWPFVPGDLVKSGLSAGLLPLGWKLVGGAAGAQKK